MNDLQSQIERWLLESSKLLQEASEVKSLSDQPKEDSLEEQIFPVNENNERFKDYYHSEEGNEKEYHRRRTPEARWSKARYDAGRRKSGKKEFTLTLQEYSDIISKPCRYCNKDISMDTGSGLDRILNEQGYIMGNVSPCCQACNARRSKSMDADTFEKQSKLNGYWKE